MKERTYPMTWDLRCEDPPIARSALEQKDRGGCDAAILVSIIHRDDGSASFMVISKDGRTGQPVSIDDKFKAWFMLANDLASNPGLGDAERSACIEAIAGVRRVVLSNRKGPGLA